MSGFRYRRRSICLLILWISLPASGFFSHAEQPVQGASLNLPSKSTAERLKAPGWWPTKGDRSPAEYVGSGVCGECHEAESKGFKATAMARAASHAQDSDSLRQHDHLAFKIGPYNYQINRSDGKEVLKITKGGQSHASPLLWAFGEGRMAQTYVYQENGAFYESHLSFYTLTQSLDITPGHPHNEPPNLAEASGRRMSAEETRRCFACHTGGASPSNRFDPQHLVPGVTCESCHGPGAAHVAAIKSGNLDLAAKSIMNPANLSPVDSVEFCGACHRTWQDVASDGPTRIGPLNIRFAPYRLENSRCWRDGQEGSRITCVTCHNPHQPLAEDPAEYDAPCLKCHVAAGVTKADTDHRSACPIGVKLCVTCHMPKFKSTGFHFTFTDHWIRIAPSGAPLPD